MDNKLQQEIDATKAELSVAANENLVPAKSSSQTMVDPGAIWHRRNRLLLFITPIAFGWGILIWIISVFVAFGGANVLSFPLIILPGLELLLPAYLVGAGIYGLYYLFGSGQAKESLALRVVAGVTILFVIGVSLIMVPTYLASLVGTKIPR